ncbi:MAG: molybdopterin-dependent oxidoreductase [Planctomycetota bacterium]
MTSPLAVAGLVTAGEQQLSLEDCRAFQAAHQVDLDQQQGGAALPWLDAGRAYRAVRFAALMERAEPELDARWVVFESADGERAASLPLEEVALDAWIVYECDGEALGDAAGGPFRLVIPGYRDPAAEISGLGRVEFADVPGRDTRDSRGAAAGPRCGERAGGDRRVG